jgi:hypothetical protein
LREDELDQQHWPYPNSNREVIGPNVADEIFEHPELGYCSYQESIFQKGAYKHGRLNQINDCCFVGPDFVQNPTYMAIGCSQTYVNGMPWNLSWPHLVANFDDATINAAGFPGQSIARITQEAMKIIAKYGPPEILMFLVPDMLRADLPHGMPIGVYDYNQKEYVVGDKNGQPVPLVIQSKIDKRQKKPYDIPIDLVANYNLVVLETFAQACEALDIELRMYSWEANTNYAMHSLRNRNWLRTAPHACVDAHKSRELAKAAGKWNDESNNYENIVGIGKTPENHQIFVGQALPKEAILWHTEFCQCGYKPNTNSWVQDHWTWADDMPDMVNRTPHHGLHTQIHLAETFAGEQFGQRFVEGLRPFWMADGVSDVDYLKEWS